MSPASLVVLERSFALRMQVLVDFFLDHLISCWWGHETLQPIEQNE